MNCKEGDLAVIVRSGYGHEGKIVRCLKPYFGLVRNSKTGGIDFSPTDIFVWEIDTPLFKEGSLYALMNDDCLRPIRNEPGADITLTWCDVPKGVAA